MQTLSVHVVDVANGRVARDMRVDVLHCAEGRWREVVSGKVAGNGLVDAIEGVPEPLGAGEYELRLHVADYYRARGTALPEPPFMGVQVFRFAIADTDRHYHLPVKLTPWGLSCFRGA
ncbi:hydroxyisourate hydrolase [Pseudorhodoferax sp.]|uniref:hydroxyisourate hydrolase n=1 Tax=Pseudorhodoferax sp. TaxID=1993553 RepID=UPI0039E6127D